MVGPGTAKRVPAIQMSGADFQRLGHHLVDQVAHYLDSLPARPVAPANSPIEVRRILGNDPLPKLGNDPERLLDETARLLFDHSLSNGHPRFWGYITSSAAPIGMLADLLASAVNPNVGAWGLSPMATEIEAQTVRWIAELIGFPRPCGGLLVSGGNMANFVCFLAARRAKSARNVRASGLSGQRRRLRVYATQETHTWIQKAVDLFGLGMRSIHWIPTDEGLRMIPAALDRAIRADAKRGQLPLLVVGTAGTTATGAVDPLPELAEMSEDQGLWFHVDGAYGAPAVCLPDASEDLKGLSRADSVAVDPHKWLYAPLEAGCALVRDPKSLRDTFSHHPVYYQFDEAEDQPAINYHEYGPQNSRGFRALKVWLALRQVGREGYEKMIAGDMELARTLYRRVEAHPGLAPGTQSLSITTFRYVPEDLRTGSESAETYLNRLNQELLTRLQKGGQVYVSNAVVEGKFLLRACVVNFRTSQADIDDLPGIVARVGRELDVAMRPPQLRGGNRRSAKVRASM